MQPQDHYDRILQVIKPFAEEFVDVDGNIPPHPGRRPKCSDLNLSTPCRCKYAEMRIEVLFLS